MNYRSVADLNRIIVDNLHLISPEVDLIVGVPRSGMLVANLLALHINKPLTDVDGYINNRLMSSGLQRSKIGQKIDSISQSRKALVIDDSLCSGREMKRVRGLIEKAGLTDKTIFATAICKPGMEQEVDLFFDLCPVPRVFEWNLMHGHILPHSCVGIDGVLCIDPTNEQNDDGPKYEEFLRTATPLWRPTSTIGILVTSRLEKYRDITEAWLANQGIKYEKLEMMQYKTLKERQEAETYGSFKASIYAASNKVFFIVSSDESAAEIAKLSGKFALCIETHRVYDPSGMSHIKQQLKEVINNALSINERIIFKLKSYLAYIIKYRNKFT